MEGAQLSAGQGALLGVALAAADGSEVALLISPQWDCVCPEESRERGQGLHD